MKLPELIWRLSSGGYRLHRFFNRMKVNRLKPKKSIVNLHLLKKMKARRLLAKSDKLHLGCGTTHLEGFINIDAVLTPALDFRCRLNKLSDFFPENSLSEIYICHTLEHLPSRFLSLYLKQFHGLLKTGGLLRISVPDIEKCLIVSRKQQWTDKQIDWLQGMVGGAQDHKYNYHTIFFWPEYLKRKLEQAGFANIEEYPLTPHFAGDDVRDASNVAGFELYGMGISLNMKGEKLL
ncbi:MAG: hypothetical protein P4L44_07950 [Oryzomonas sp.]|uniref:class I SAM-dependent methyltransferase n=1 Tax=Oryzomonas sp. TaxID=2855186 RepID=UPI0028513CB6|nr:methyltransferase domain-containing protein [Oryzomonas sp.]MDR3579876.1 hypothetical protein [Oryzomonas sp.]